MHRKTLKRGACFCLAIYALIAGGPALEARAEPPSHRKVVTTSARTTHEHEGERDNPRGESAQPVQSSGAGGAGATGPIGPRTIYEALPFSAADCVVPQPLGPRNIVESRSSVAPVLQGPRWQYDQQTKQGKLTCSGDPAHAAYWRGPEKEAQRGAAVNLVLRQPGV